MSVLLAKMLAGYLLGSVSGSLWLGRLRGVDIRTMGSGNAGGTNAFRTQGPWFGFSVGLVDVGKGLLSAWLGGLALWGSEGGLGPALCTGAAAAAGHVWPLYHGFRGGKGVAVVLGVLLWVWPAGLGVLVAVLLLTLATTGYVGLGSVLGAVSLVPAAWLLRPETDRAAWLAAAVATAAFVTFTHRANLARLRAGTEHRFERARVLARLFRR